MEGVSAAAAGNGGLDLVNRTGALEVRPPIAGPLATAVGSGGLQMNAVEVPMEAVINDSQQRVVDPGRQPAEMMLAG